METNEMSYNKDMNNQDYEDKRQQGKPSKERQQAREQKRQF